MTDMCYRTVVLDTAYPLPVYWRLGILHLLLPSHTMGDGLYASHEAQGYVDSLSPRVVTETKTRPADPTRLLPGTCALA